MPAKKLTAKEKEAVEQDKERTETDLADQKKRTQISRLFRQTPAGQLLETSLSHQDVFHAYLFFGPADSLKDDAALLFGASILAGSDHLIDETEETGETAELISQVYHGEHSDFICLDGTRREAIKKEEIDEIQKRFSRTASSAAGRKVYIITRAENSSLNAMNSLLKFLEEPSGNVFAILTTDNLERLLPTIRSRCITVQFHSLPEETMKELCRAEGLDEEDVYFLSTAAVRPDELGRTAAGRSYQTAKKMLKQYLNAEGSRELLYVDYENRYRSKAGSDDGEGVRFKDARDENLDTLDFFFRFLMQYYHAVCANDAEGPAWYHESAARLRQREDYMRVCTACMKAAADGRDKVNRNNDLSLLLAQTLVRLEDI